MRHRGPVRATVVAAVLAVGLLACGGDGGTDPDLQALVDEPVFAVEAPADLVASRRRLMFCGSSGDGPRAVAEHTAVPGRGQEMWTALVAGVEAEGWEPVGGDVGDGVGERSFRHADRPGIELVVSTPAAYDEVELTLRSEAGCDGSSDPQPVE